MPDAQAIARLQELLRQDRRYKPAAYQFVLESLQFAHEQLRQGAPRASEPSPHDAPPPASQKDVPERHLTGQELCQAARQYALGQYGNLARLVLDNWGVRSTGDIGEIVYNMIRVGLMKKTREDRREDFDDVFDFQEALQGGFRTDGSS
jgi:uncharacterized repeat protein (TIGR04138 family)